MAVHCLILLIDWVLSVNLQYFYHEECYFYANITYVCFFSNR